MASIREQLRESGRISFWLLVLAGLGLVAILPARALAECGNGTLEAGEWCDDGNGVFGDGCRPNCTWEASAVEVGDMHACALTLDGAVKCWGMNEFGPLGNGTTTNSLLPVDVTGLANEAIAIAALGEGTCALTAQGDVKCWGYDGGFGLLGSNHEPSWQSSLVPVTIGGLGQGVEAITSGRFHVCALTTLGGVKCWGSNSYGQLGNGAQAYSNRTPVDVSGLETGVVKISAGSTHTCALMAAGGVKCWGSNFHGEIGNGSVSDPVLIPVEVYSLASGVIAISAGGFDGDSHSCAVKFDGTIKCWGNNLQGQLGDGTKNQRLFPVEVAGLGEPAISVAAGGLNTCALLANGRVKCWGWNGMGQLGDGTTDSSVTPREVTLQDGGFTALSFNGYTSCAVTNQKSVRCWGEGEWGQILSLVPAEVSGFPSPCSGQPDGSACGNPKPCRADVCEAGVCVEKVYCSETDSTDLVVKRGKALNLTIGTNRDSIKKNLAVSIRNLDSKSQKVSLHLDTSECPFVVASAIDADAVLSGNQTETMILAGKSKKAKVTLTLGANSVATFGRKAPSRCRVRFEARVDVESGIEDRTLENNQAVFELNVTDRNDPEQTGYPELLVRSAASIGLSIPRNAGEVRKVVRGLVVNGDYLSQSAHPIRLSAGSSCSGLAIESVQCQTGGPADVVNVPGGQTKSCKITLRATASLVSTPESKSPRRCTVTLEAVGPDGPEAAPLDPSNNRTEMIVDIVDRND